MKAYIYIHLFFSVYMVAGAEIYHMAGVQQRTYTDLNYWIKLLSCIIEANGGHIGLSHINLHWYY